MQKTTKFNSAYIEAAEQAIGAFARTVKFTVVEYTFEFIVEKLEKGRYYIPEYQRNLVWTPKVTTNNNHQGSSLYCHKEEPTNKVMLYA